MKLCKSKFASKMKEKRKVSRVWKLKKNIWRKSAKNKSSQSDQVTQFSHRGGSSGCFCEIKNGLPGRWKKVVVLRMRQAPDE